MELFGWVLFFVACCIAVFLSHKLSSVQSSIESLSECRESYSKSENDKLELVRSHQKIKDQLDQLNSFYREETSKNKKFIEKLEKDLYNEEQSRKTTLSQKKSSEVRLGNIAEKLAPFLEDFPYDPEDAIFAGKPIDYIVFDDEAVVFVEIKSGNSQLSKKQRHIRDLIKNNCVEWKEIRIK